MSYSTAANTSTSTSTSWNPASTSFPYQQAPTMPHFPSPPTPFRLVFIKGNISTCQGCKYKFPRNSDGSIVDPPYNIVIQHEQNRTFKNPTTSSIQTKVGNAYYHVYLPCVTTNWPYFVGQDVLISDSVKEQLLLSHKELIYFNLGVFLN